MATPNAVQYHVFVTFDVKLGLAPIGTIDELRSGVWYSGIIAQAFSLYSAFREDTSLPRGSDVTLDIADDKSGPYRAQAIGGGLNGSLLTVLQVLREVSPTGVVSEVTRTQSLTVSRCKLTPTGVTLSATDIETKQLDALYPPLLWKADDWPQLADTDAGKPLCYPVGTALKFPCPQIVSDDTNAQYFFGACTGTPRLLTIASINSGAKQVTISGGVLTDIVEAGQVVYITGSTAADGRYTVSVVNSTTVFTVVETLPASTGGSVRCMPHVLTVYRNGRVVDPSEYSVIHVAASPALVNGDFATHSFFGWAVSVTGSGSADATTAVAVLTQVSIVNTANIRQTVPISKDLWVGVAMDVISTSTASARVSSATSQLDNTRFIAPGGRGAALFRATATNAAHELRFGPSANGVLRLDNIVTFGQDLVAILFTRPQVDFNGSAYKIEADVRGVDSRNAATEVSRLLTAAGVTPDGTSITAAAAVATTNEMFVDCDYGRAGQRTVRAILDDHLYLLRGCLQRTATGTYGIVQDASGSPVVTLDESLGDSVEVDSAEWEGSPSSVGISYRPGAADPGVLQNTVTRAVGGALGDETPRAMPYVRSHVTADRLLCYRAQRAAYNGKASATIYRKQFELGNVIALSCPILWGATVRNWIARTIERAAASNKLDMIEYNAAVYTYTASQNLPTDSLETPYEPDYSQTPPAAPTALTITSTAVALAADGTSTARVTVTCVPPAVNWAQIWFSVIHNVTGEVIIGQGADNGFGVFTTTLTGLRPGNVYQLKAYAVNAFNLQGVQQGTFNATAIGGGAAATTFTTPGYATLPPNVASCTALQGTGLIVQVSWPVVSLPADILGDYILERKINAGAFAEVWRGRANSYADRDFSQYGLLVTYRVRASDRWGNLSAAYATSSIVTLSRTIFGGNGVGSDIRDNTVGTVNRTGVSTVSVGYGNPTPQSNISFSHSLGVVPLVTYDVNGKTNVWVGIGNVTSSSVSANVNRHFPFGATIVTGNNSVAGDPHTHTITPLWTPDPYTVNFYIW